MSALTVVIPTCNRSTLPGAVDSALSQLRPGDQVCVVDDCSDTPVELDRESLQLRCIRLDHRSGVSAARNAGAEHSQTALVAFLDDDDRYMEGALEQLRRPFDAADSDCGFAFGRRRHVDAHGRRVGEDQFEAMDVVANQVAGQQLLCLARLTSSCGWVFRCDRFLKLGGFDPSLQVSEDRDLIYRLLQTGARIVGLDQLCIDYLRPGTMLDGLSSTQSSAIKLASEARVIAKHVDWFRDHPEVASLHLNRTASRQRALGDMPAARDTLKLLCEITPWSLRAWRRRLTW